MNSTVQEKEKSPYTAYAYSYPHKTAYRKLTPAIRLEDAWKNVKKDSLFLYMHIPFCEMRCGFCNLFTTAHPSEEMQDRYIEALELEARVVRSALGDCRFARMAVGGGTPTQLPADCLERLFLTAAEVFGLDGRQTPISVETSPGTATDDKLRLLHRHNVERISIGVQSFLEAESAAAGRSQRNTEVDSALGRIKDLGFPVLNIDLIYGLYGQTRDSWLFSLKRTLEYEPQEIYIYPLYVRPLTGLGKQGKAWTDSRAELYDLACDFLGSHGFRQVSMRMFEKTAEPRNSSGPHYCCQSDGMVGIGAGARSYTQELHYSSNYAVGSEAVRSIIENYSQSSSADFSAAVHGFCLNREEQKRRFVIQSLLQVEGLSIEDYQDRFQSSPFADLPFLSQLLDSQFARKEGNKLLLTESGLARSDAISFELYSDEVKQLMEDYHCK